MRHVRVLVSAFLAVLAFAVNCGAEPPTPVVYTLVDPPPGSLVLDSSTYAADSLVQNLSARMITKCRVVTANLVSLDNLDESSLFGRLAASQISARLIQYGYAMVETRLRPQVDFSVRGGEFLLSRDFASRATNDFNAYAALVGTYARASGKLFVSVRVVRLSDGVALASYEYFLRMTPEVWGVVSDPSLGDRVWERYAKRKPAFSEGVAFSDIPRGRAEAMRRPLTNPEGTPFNEVPRGSGAPQQTRNPCGK